MNKNVFRLSLILLALFVAFTLLVFFADKNQVLAPSVDESAEPVWEEVGFSTVNDKVSDLFPFNETWYKITEIIGYVSIAAGLVFAFVGLFQLIKRKSFAKVDRVIYCLGGLYVALGLAYVFFEKVVVNLRPVLLKGETELAPSYPSSHTMLATVVLGGVIFALGEYIKNKKLAAVLRAVCGALIVVNVCGRIISGAHWITDIVGGVLLSAALLSFFLAFAFPEEKESDSATDNKE